MNNNIVSQFTNNSKLSQLTHNNIVKKFRTCLVFLLFSVFLINISSFKVLAASTLTVTPTVEKNKVSFKIGDSANLSDAISILVMQKGTNTVIFMDQGKLNNGEYTFSTVLPKGDYTGYVSSSSTDNVPIQDFTVVNEEKIVGFRTMTPINVGIGSEVVLPSTVIAIFDDGANRIVAVNWSSAADTTKAGKQTILGSISESDAKPSIEVIVGGQTSSSDATLSGITVGGVAVANFAADKTSYDIELPAGTKTVPEVIGTVTVTGKANAVVKSATSLPGATKILVTAEDGVTTKTYTINFTVANSLIEVERLIPQSGGFKLGDPAKVRIKVTNNGKESKNVALIVALFDDNNRMVIYGASQSTIEASKQTELEVMMNIPSSGKYNVKYFVWDSLDTQQAIEGIAPGVIPVN